MWVTKLLISPGKIRNFLPKIGIFVHFGPAHLVPCWWVGWWLWRGLYLASHLFTLYYILSIITKSIMAVVDVQCALLVPPLLS